MDRNHTAMGHVAPLDVASVIRTDRTFCCIFENFADGPGITTVHAMSGLIHTVDARGYVTVSADDAEPLLRTGWQRVDKLTEAAL
jgi:hypothetical protein